MADIKTIKEHSIVDVIGSRLELKPDGAEFLGLCPFHQEETPSFTVVPNKGFYHCFGCGAHGDLVDFICEYYNINPEESGWLDRVAEHVGSGVAAGPARAPAVLPDQGAKWTPVVPLPDDAPKIMLADKSGYTTKIFNPKRDKASSYKPEKIYTYRNAAGVVGYVLRCRFPDGKKYTPQVTYCQHEDGRRQWCVIPMPKPRPLYGLMDLLAKPEAKVVIVEGEKCQNAAKTLFPEYVALSWAGGANGIGSADWSVVANRRVLLWPDADSPDPKSGLRPGIEAMKTVAATLHAQDCHVMMIDPFKDATPPDGWDCADALKEGQTADKVMDWVSGRVRKYTPPQAPNTDPSPPAASPPPERKKPSLSVVGSSKKGNTVAKEKPEDTPQPWFEAWQALALDLNHTGMPLNNLNNAVKILYGHRDLAGKIWFDEFHFKYFTSWGGEVREITDHDTLSFTVFIQNHVGIKKMSDDTVHKAVVIAGRRLIRNEPREWMESLKWDGIPRVKESFVNYFGAPNSQYTRDAARNFWISMVARVLEPGCQVDNMVIFESFKQGTGKTSAMRVIGGKYHTEAQESVTSKDFFMALQGKFLVEIAEMDAFSRAEESRIKQVITQRVDRYRAPYARAPQDRPRMNVFVGTANDWNFRDHTGGRRFWPIKCGLDIDLPRLQMDREQLFAEAVELYKDGEPWHNMTKDAEAEQEKHRIADTWEDVIADGVGLMENVDMNDVLGYLKIEVGKADLATQHRIGRIMRSLGWEKNIDGGKAVKWRKRK